MPDRKVVVCLSGRAGNNTRKKVLRDCGLEHEFSARFKDGILNARQGLDGMEPNIEEIYMRRSMHSRDLPTIERKKHQLSTHTKLLLLALKMESLEFLVSTESKTKWWVLETTHQE
ncbi:unnamed protein product [Dovyalis caffra]|uniref:Uncharacterized protein n=1 Tax=Dovyalis caffra TaxID=77055 RepID=A0AAV1RH11_9ROSI|nr:unnamed protein product [Dovyalis caffra]